MIVLIGKEKKKNQLTLESLLMKFDPNCAESFGKASLYAACLLGYVESRCECVPKNLQKPKKIKRFKKIKNNLKNSYFTSSNPLSYKCCAFKYWRCQPVQSHL